MKAAAWTLGKPGRLVAAERAMGWSVGSRNGSDGGPCPAVGAP